jgi:hypothetical protein
MEAGVPQQEIVALSVRLLQGIPEFDGFLPALEAFEVFQRGVSLLLAASIPASPTSSFASRVRSAPAKSPIGFASLIITDFPALFAEFLGKRFTLLWRGSRDGFGAGDFHFRCDSHAPTLTLIEDYDGNIFGGFAAVALESREWNGKDGKEDNCWKGDPSLKSFIFTLKNPYNFPATKFVLKDAENNYALWCDSDWGPCFSDISVCDHCNTNAGSVTYFDDDFSSYPNSTGLVSETRFAGLRSFKVKEIEVFEITG